MYKFVVVRFVEEGKSYSAVSERWINNGDASGPTCHYPKPEEMPKKVTLKSLVTSHADSSSWKEYPVKIYGKYDAFKDADDEVVRLINEELTTCDEEADTEQIGMKLRTHTKSNTKRFLDDSESEDDSEDKRPKTKTARPEKSALPPVPVPPIPKELSPRNLSSTKSSEHQSLCEDGEQRNGSIDVGNTSEHRSRPPRDRRSASNHRPRDSRDRRSASNHRSRDSRDSRDRRSTSKHRSRDSRDRRSASKHRSRDSRDSRGHRSPSKHRSRDSRDRRSASSSKQRSRDSRDRRNASTSRQLSRDSRDHSVSKRRSRDSRDRRSASKHQSRDSRDRRSASNHRSRDSRDSRDRRSTSKHRSRDSRDRRSASKHRSRDSRDRRCASTSKERSRDTRDRSSEPMQQSGDFRNSSASRIERTSYFLESSNGTRDSSKSLSPTRGRAGVDSPEEPSDSYLHNDFVFRKAVIEGLASSKTLLVKLGNKLLSGIIPPDRNLDEIRRMVPVTSANALRDLNKELHTNADIYKQLVAHLSLGGGDDIGNATRTAFRKILTDEVQQQYNWEGQKGKKKFADFVHIKRALFESVRAHFPHASDADIKSYITCDLRNAKQRCEASYRKKREAGNSDLLDEVDTENEGTGDEGTGTGDEGTGDGVTKD